MTVSEQLTRITSDRNTIRNKLVQLGLAESTANLDALATAIAGIVSRGAVQATVRVGESYTIPAGYHNGSGTVSGVQGTDDFKLQGKSATPTKATQTIAPDTGFYGLSSVTVNAIPEAYQDVSSVDAVASDVLAGKLYVLSDGTLTTGTMPNNGKVTTTIDIVTSSYTIPAGYHNGQGTVSIISETKSATPTKSSQTISASSGKVLSSVTVNPIPEEYIDTSDATAVASDIRSGKTAYIDGEEVTGTMTDNGAISGTITGLGAVAGDTSYTVPAGYTSGGTVSLTSDIENTLALV